MLQATVEIIEALDERLAAADPLALQDLDDEIGNARAALDWAIAASELTLAQRLERALRRYWQRRHLQSEARIWADRVRARPRRDARDVPRGSPTKENSLRRICDEKQTN